MWPTKVLTLLSASLVSLNEAISMSLQRNVAASQSAEFTGISSSSKVRLLTTAEVEANMTIRHAYSKFLRMNHSKFDKKVVTFIEETIKGHGKQNADKQTPQDYMDAVDKARILLNEMMDEALIEKDQEEISCRETESTTWKAIKDTEHAISYANSEATAARMEVLRAKEVIRILEEVNLPTARTELTEHERKCAEDEATLRQQLAIVKADRTVVEQIMEMICADDLRTPVPAGQQPVLSQTGSISAVNSTQEGLMKCVSCHTGREAIWFRHMKIEPLLAKLKSKVAKDFVEQNLMEEFGSPDKKHPVHTVFMAESDKERRMANPVTVPALESRFNVTVEPNPPKGTCNEQMVGQDSVGYRGCQSKTIHGKKCQAWDSSDPHNHSFTEENYPDAGLAENYCRNPNNRSTIWCMTTDPAVEWEYCEPLVELEAPGEASRYGGCEDLDLCRFRKSDCVKMTDRFMVILSGIIDTEQYLTNTLDRILKECEITRNSYHTSIESMEGHLSEEQTNLASAQKTLIENVDTSQRENERHSDLVTEYTEENEECCNNINEWKGQICAIKKIRGELYKLQGMNVTINDCEVGEWISEECSVSCGGGTQSISRSITVHPNLGMQCPPLHGERSCNLEGCPIDCKLSEWEGWGPCTADCGGGVQSRTREKTVEPANGGDVCPELSETQECNTQACSKNCDLGDWGDWGVCSRQCDGGHSERVKRVVDPARGQGTCPSLVSPQRYGIKECNDYNCKALLGGDRTTLKCNAMIDLVLVLDGSGSLGQEGWDETKSLARKLVEAMELGEMAVQMAIIEFSGPWSSRMLDKCTGDNPNDVPSRKDCGMQWVSHMTSSKETLLDGIEKMEWLARTTLTSVAISEASQELIAGRSDALPVIMVVTDGKPMFKTRTQVVAEEVRPHARLMFVPVQASDEMVDEMKSLASTPVEDNVITISDFAIMDIPQTINKIVSTTCSTVE